MGTDVRERGKRQGFRHRNPVEGKNQLPKTLVERQQRGAEPDDAHAERGGYQKTEGDPDPGHGSRAKGAGELKEMLRYPYRRLFGKLFQ